VQLIQPNLNEIVVVLLAVREVALQGGILHRRGLIKADFHIVISLICFLRDFCGAV
jgi:hypothetical protein